MLARAAQPAVTSQPGVGRPPRAPGRCLAVRVTSQRGGGVPQQPQGGPPAGGAPLPLPGGALWWQSLHAGGTRPVYGPLAHDTFVMQRPVVGGPGLVRVPRQPKPVRSAPPAPAGPPMLWVGPPAGAGLALAGSSLGSCSVVVDTDFVVLQPQPPAVQPNTSCVGIVWQRSADSGQGAEASAAAAARGRRRSRHPRRTQMVRGHGGTGLGCAGCCMRRPASSAAVGARRHGTAQLFRRLLGHLPPAPLPAALAWPTCCCVPPLQLRFTCNLCGETNDCEVNPHAWAKGSVFARCQVRGVSWGWGAERALLAWRSSGAATFCSERAAKSAPRFTR